MLTNLPNNPPIRFMLSFIGQDQLGKLATSVRKEFQKTPIGNISTQENSVERFQLKLNAWLEMELVVFLVLVMCCSRTAW